VPHHIFYNF